MSTTSKAFYSILLALKMLSYMSDMMVGQKCLYGCECDLVTVSGLDSDRLRKAVSCVLSVSARFELHLPGHCVPELYAVKRVFSHGEKIQIDFSAIEKIIGAEISASMSERALLVREFANKLV